MSRDEDVVVSGQFVQFDNDGSRGVHGGGVGSGVDERMVFDGNNNNNNSNNGEILRTFAGSFRDKRSRSRCSRSVSLSIRSMGTWFIKSPSGVTNSERHSKSPSLVYASGSRNATGCISGHSEFDGARLDPLRQARMEISRRAADLHQFARAKI